MTQALLESGFTTLRFDFFGSGQSPGTMSDKRISILAQNLSDAIAYLVGIGYENIGLFGRSVGGTVVLLCGTDPHIKAIVVASAVTNTDSFIDEYKVLKQRELELEKRGEKLPGTGAYKGKFELSEGWFAEMGSIKGKLQTIMPQLKNILILATTPDQKVGLDNATALVNVARDPKFIRIFEKTDHGYEGAEKEAVSLSTDWFKKYVPVG
jgi:esterase/lipase